VQTLSQAALTPEVQQWTTTGGAEILTKIPPSSGALDQLAGAHGRTNLRRKKLKIMGSYP
jgi:hypothetical protein